jgi:hypothetical protein
MHQKFHIKSTLILMGVLFSFMLGAYISLSTFCREGSPRTKVHVDIPKQSNCSNDILSEELESENDNDDLLSDAFVLLPFSGLSLDVFRVKLPVSRLIASQDTPGSIWLSIRVFRI